MVKIHYQTAQLLFEARKKQDDNTYPKHYVLHHTYAVNCGKGTTGNGCATMPRVLSTVVNGTSTDSTEPY